MAASRQLLTDLRDIAALPVEVKHFPVVILDFIENDRSALGGIGLAGYRVLFEQRLEPLIVDMLR